MADEPVVVVGSGDLRTAVGVRLVTETMPFARMALDAYDIPICRMAEMVEPTGDWLLVLHGMQAALRRLVVVVDILHHGVPRYEAALIEAGLLDHTPGAEHYRLQQARGLIRSVVAIYVDDEKPATRVRAYVHVPEAGAPHYRDTAHAMSAKKTRDLVLQRAWRELQSWRARYAELKHFSEVFDAIDEAGKKLPPRAKSG